MASETFIGRICLVAWLLLPLWATAQADELVGFDIAKQVFERNKLPYEREDTLWVLTDKSGKREERRVRRWSRRGDDGNYKHLLLFLDPPEVRGMGFLVWQYLIQNDDEWLYLPTSGTLQHISPRSRRNYFMGTDFTYEDLLISTGDSFSYKRLPDQAIGGHPCYVLDIYPDDEPTRQTTGYSHRIVWVRKDSFFIVRSDYYDRRNRLIKRRTTLELVKVAEGVWRENKTLMENFADHHRTEVTSLDRRLDQASVPVEVFTKEYLTSGQALKDISK
jgi:hypothetical protein